MRIYTYYIYIYKSLIPLKDYITELRDIRYFKYSYIHAIYKMTLETFVDLLT